ncbi:MAG TPA: gamma-glutamylcyclotransferase [Actinocrinis sp.]|uniref:allophanate hydrolase-related protein n=1 Tax=Actinocrinis sp. TaxID=1920516 RepID=UPI002DDD41E3|nr:gamma-glutamylcyclotransferase [Actinocrinis sp.]HEV3172420.1 gamma-glutamylcyclotransferase [Actinocrinis sp.]
MPHMFLNGGAMRGGPLHHLLDGAPLVGVVRTAPKYRFYSVGDRFPALDPELGDSIGVRVVGELYDVRWETLRERLLPAEPDELELGVIELEDGTGTLAMVRRRTYAEPEDAYRDISDHADWRAYAAQTAGG